MTDAKQRFEDALKESLKAENVSSSAFAGFHQEKRREWVSQQAVKLLEQEHVGRITTKQLEAKFDEVVWPEMAKKVQAETMKAYDGKPVEIDAGELMNSASTGLVAGIASGNPTEGLLFSLKHSAVNFIKNLPWVGNFLGQIKTYFEGLVSGNKLSWSEAGEKYQRNQVKNHLAEGVGQIADMNKLGEMIDRTAQESAPAPSENRPASTRSPSPSASAAPPLPEDWHPPLLPPADPTFDAPNGTLVGPPAPVPATVSNQSGAGRSSD